MVERRTFNLLVLGSNPNVPISPGLPRFFLKVSCKDCFYSFLTLIFSIIFCPKASLCSAFKVVYEKIEEHWRLNRFFVY
jgi:hypothetical protein